MDIARPSNARQKRIRQIAYVGAASVVILLITLGLSRLKPAAPTVEAATVWRDAVKRGPMLRQVRGLGTLVPEDIRWIPATTQGRVERILLRPGTTVTAGAVILELTNPQLEQELQDAELKVKGAEATLANLRVQLQNDLLQQRASAASIDAEYNKAKMTHEMKEALAKDQLVSALELKQAKVDAEQLTVRTATIVPAGIVAAFKDEAAKQMQAVAITATNLYRIISVLKVSVWCEEKHRLSPKLIVQ